MVVSTTAGVMTCSVSGRTASSPAGRLAVGDDGFFDGAEVVAVAGQDQGRRGDGSVVVEGVAGRAGGPVEEQLQVAAPVAVTLGAVVVGLHRGEGGGHGRHALEGGLGGVGVGLGGFGVAAEDGSSHGEDGGFGVEDVVAGVRREGPDGVGFADRDDGGGGGAFGEPGQQGAVESHRVDEGEDVVGEHGERGAAVAVDGGAAASGVGGDDPEVLRQRGHVGDVGDGAVGPQRAGRGEATVEQDERGPSPAST